MSFNDEIKKSASEKFSLVRLSYSSVLSANSIGSNLFTVTFNYELFDLYCENLKLTKVAGPPSAGQYSLSSDGKTATLYSTEADPYVMGRFYFYVTNDKNRTIGKDPTSPSESVIEWRGVLKNNPSFTQSVENALNGMLSISISEIQLINKNREFDFLINRETSIMNMKFDVWFCCNGVDNITYAFSGVLVESTLSTMMLTIKTKDTINRLDKKCFMGDLESECYFTEDFYTNRDPSKDGMAIPFITGKASSYKERIALGPLGEVIRTYQPDSLREAYCSSFSGTISTSTNREFVAYRTKSGFSYIGTCTFSTGITGGYDFSLPDSYTASFFFVGDTFKAGTGYFVVNSVSSNVVNASLAAGSLPTSPAIVDFSSIPLVVIERSGDFYVCLYGRDYTVSYSSITENSLYKITFVNNFEASVLPSALNPTDDIVRFRAHNEEYKHNEIVEQILTDSNIENDFDGTYTDRKICMAIPSIDESDFSSSISYLEEILNSNSSFVFQKLDGKYNYREFKTPLTTTDVTSDDILMGSLSVQENSQDIYTKINLSNKEIDTSVLKSSVESDSLKSLIQTEKTIEIKSTNYDISSHDEMVARFMLKNSKYVFNTKKIGYDFNIGDGVKINGKDLVILSIGKSIDKLNIIATDAFAY